MKKGGGTFFIGKTPRKSVWISVKLKAIAVRIQQAYITNDFHISKF